MPRLLQGKDLTVCFVADGRPKTILHSISFEIAEGEVLGILGPSGSGKSTLLRAILRLVPVERGRLFLDGSDYTRRAERDLQLLRRTVQLTFQDAAGSFDPRWPVAASIGEPVRWLTNAVDVDARVTEMADFVGLERGCLQRMPSALSGGQLRRAALARALITSPRVLLLDEPFAGLDLAAQASLLRDLARLFAALNQSVMLVSHEPSHVLALTSRCLVIEEGVVVEDGPTRSIVRARETTSL